MSEEDFQRLQEDGVLRVAPVPLGISDNLGVIIDPLPTGGFLPQLNLAGSDMNVASGLAHQSMPDPGRPWPAEYVLSGSVEMGGIDPSVPYIHLNLAGEMGMPTPDILMAAADNSIKEPTFISPDMTPSKLWPGDLSKSELNYSYGSEFSADPLMPDLTDYCQPDGLTIHNYNGDKAGLFVPDPQLDDLLDYDVPNGMPASNYPLDPDPSLPDLQDPDLTPDVEMCERPCELDPRSLDVMKQAPSWQDVKDLPYTQSRMDISGNNSSRRRKQDLRMRGLDAVDDGGKL
jgi:hypothetical protein